MTSAWRNDGCSLDLNSPGATSSTTSSISIWPDKECKPRNHDAKPGTRALTWLFGVKHVIGTCTFRELTCPKAGTIGRQHSCAGTMASLLGPCRSTPLRPKLSTAETATPQKPTAHHPIDRPPSAVQRSGRPFGLQCLLPSPRPAWKEASNCKSSCPRNEEKIALPLGWRPSLVGWRPLL